MPIQKKVGLYLASAVAGDMATPDQAFYQPVNFTAEEDINVGTFCYPGTDPATQAKQGGTVTQAKQGGTVPLGLVQRVIAYVNYDMSSDGSMIAPKDSTLTVAVRGDFWVKTTTTATVGQKVYASLTDGTIKTDAAGQTNVGYVETNWTVKTAGQADELIIISNWA